MGDGSGAFVAVRGGWGTRGGRRGHRGVRYIRQGKFIGTKASMLRRQGGDREW